MKEGRMRMKKTPFNTLMFLGFITIGILAYITPDRFINKLFIMLTITLVLDGVYFFLLIPFLKVTISTPKIIQKDERLILKIHIINKASLPSSYIYIRPKDVIRATIEKKQALLIMLGAKQERERELLYHTKFYGNEQMVFEELFIRSFIGFFRKSVAENIMAAIKILPNIKQIEYIQHLDDFLLSLNRREDKQKNKLNNESIEDEVGYDLSPYIEGDNQRLIHWKIVAARDEYLVRQREQKKEWKRELVFILNPLVQYQSINEQVVIQDKMITSVISLVDYYINQGQEVKVIYYKDEKWRSIKIRETKAIYFLQDILSDYEGIKVEECTDIQKIIKELLKFTQTGLGYKFIISSYWERQLDKYIIKDYIIEKSISIIWTHLVISDNIGQKLFSSIWHMTDHYELVLCTEENLKGMEVIDGCIKGDK